MEIKNILIVDDHFEEFEEDLKNSFHEKDCKLHFCIDKESAMNALDSGINFDLVILDWYLERENNLLSKSVLTKIRSLFFIPVFIWTQHKVDYEESYNSGEIDFPKDLIYGVDKNEINPETIKEILEAQMSNCLTIKLSEIYRTMIHKGLEQIFFELSGIHNIELAVVLRIIMGDGDNVDWSSDFILNLLHRKLVREEVFESKLRELLITLPADNVTEGKFKNLLINKILYFFPNSKYPRFGDIILYKTEHIKLFGLIINPDCDLEQKKSRYIEIIELVKFDDATLQLTAGQKSQIKNNNHPSFYYLPCMLYNHVYTDLIAIFKSKTRLEAVRDYTGVKYPEIATEKMSFDDKFIIGGKEVEIELISAFSEPYKSDLLNKLTSHNTRIGIPDIKKLWLV